jgi:hypothetical protein
MASKQARLVFKSDQMLENKNIFVQRLCGGEFNFVIKPNIVSQL